jgi:AcrR family transcriptional regulator
MGSKERRQRERDDVRAKIMNAARELFVSEGIESVSMRKIADAVEYSPTVIYQYFTDKEGLLHEICTEDFANLAQTFQQLAQIEDPLERIGQIGITYGKFGLAYPNHYRLMFMTPLRAAKDETDACHKGNPDEDAYAFLRQAVVQAIEAKKFRQGVDDPDLVSQVLWAAVHGVVSLQVTKASNDWLQWRPFEQRMNLMLDSLFHGMAR